MDLVVMPFHDVAKAAVIGWGRRDLQLIRRLAGRGRHRVLVANRPTTFAHRALGLHRAWDRFGGRELVPSPCADSQLWHLPRFGSLWVLDWEAPGVLGSLVRGRACGL
jgi:hypothetical protein